MCDVGMLLSADMDYQDRSEIILMKSKEHIQHTNLIMELLKYII